MKISLVVAVAENNAIGANGNLMWRLSKDMQRFKEITMDHHILMGRKTWDSIPVKFRPLKGRTNMVVTHQDGFKIDGAVVVPSTGRAIEVAEKDGENELMVIGGGEIYRQLFDKADKIYLTKVHHTFADADTFFPELSPNEWKELSSEWNMADEKNQYDFEFVVLERKGRLNT